MRYQEWWFSELPKEFRKANFEVKILGERYANNIKKVGTEAEHFSPITQAIDFECMQIQEYMSIKVRDDDMLFMTDISFPGIFPSVLFHKRPKKVFAFCHATSLNYLDYFQHDRDQKFPTETAHAELCDIVFVGSKYHQQKLGWKNTSVVYLPYPPFKPASGTHKSFNVCSAARLTEQKVDLVAEDFVEKRFSCKVQRLRSKTWEQYFSFLNNSKVLLITSKEDTFGYQIADAVINDCIPIAPRRLSYPEILPRLYLYENGFELIEKVGLALNGKLDVPELLCHQEMKDFYKNIIKTMKGE
jgi:hypothetical protein